MATRTIEFGHYFIYLQANTNEETKGDMPAATRPRGATVVAVDRTEPLFLRLTNAVFPARAWLSGAALLALLALAGLALNGPDDMGVAVTGGVDGNAGRKIQKNISIHVMYPQPLGMIDHKRVNPGVRR